MSTSSRSPLLTVAAVCFALLAISDVLKPLQLAQATGYGYVFFPELMEYERVAAREQTGFVFFGKRLSGTSNALVGALFGLYLFVYAAGIWRMRRWALPMGAVYAAYVLLNLTLFMVRDPEPMRESVLLGVVYALIAIGVSSGAVWLLFQRRAALS